MQDFKSIPLEIRIPLYKLYYIDNLNEFQGLTEAEINQLKSAYLPDVLAAIKKALQWGANNLKYDFKTLLPAG